MRVKHREFPGSISEQVTEREIRNGELARRAAEEGFVLLKNEGQILPVPKRSKIGLYGAGASRTVKGGTGSGDVNERSSISIYQGLLQAGYEITSEKWLKEYDVLYARTREKWQSDIEEKMRSSGMPFFQAYFETPFFLPCGSPAEPAAREDGADLAVYVISRVSGEGRDRRDVGGDYFASEEEIALLESLCRCYENVLLVINTGGQIDLGFTEDFPNVKAILQFVQAGQEGGAAFARILSGEISPSGKLTDTWALCYEDFPNADIFSYKSGDLAKEKYCEGIYVGYRYFDTFEKPVRFCFGYGLSYTSFSVRFLDAVLEKAGTRELEIIVEVQVENTGNRYAGKEVAQVYVSCPCGTIPKEKRRLAGFWKTGELMPGEKENGVIRIPVRQLASYSEERSAWILEKGNYGIYVGNSLQAATLSALVYVNQDAVMEQCRPVCQGLERVSEIYPDQDRARQRESLMEEEAEKRKLKRLVLCASDIASCPTAYQANETAMEEEAGRLIEMLSEEQLISLATGAGDEESSMVGNAGRHVPGAAGETSAAAAEKPWEIVQIVLADGPAGLRLRQKYRIRDGLIVQLEEDKELSRDLFVQEDENEGTARYQFCTALPVGTLLAQSWNTDILEEVGAMIGSEMKLFGVTLWLAPGMNIHRNPLGGRNFEYYSEDPFLTGVLAAAITRGVQKNYGCGTTLKHLACNNQEDNRLGSDSLVSERALREIYLKGFEIAVKQAHPMAVMTSYNMINGIHTANSYDLCTGILREEWGFDGVVVTDWMTTLSSTAGDCDAAGCIKAGNDLIMPGTEADRSNIRNALRTGTISLSELKRSVFRTIRLILRSNQYEKN